MKKELRILVLSDTHKSINKAIKLIESIEKIDVIIHLGDYVLDAYNIKYIFPHIKMLIVSGNNDFSSNEKDSLCIELEGKKLFLTHGHLFSVKNRLLDLENKAKEQNADIVLFGHTHKSFNKIINNTLFLNPGSACAMFGNEASYGIIEIEN